MNSEEINKELAVATTVSAHVESMSDVIETEEDAFRAAEYLMQARQAFNTVEETRKRYTAPSNAAIKAINDDFNIVTEPLSLIEKKLKPALEAYANKRSELDRVKLRDLRRETGDNKLTMPLGIAKLTSESGDVRFRKDFTVIVVDPSLVPEEYISIDIQRIHADIKHTDGNLHIPGITVEDKHTAAIYIK